MLYSVYIENVHCTWTQHCLSNVVNIISTWFHNSNKYAMKEVLPININIYLLIGFFLMEISIEKKKISS